MLKIVLPKGSLEAATLELFREADLEVRRSSDVDYRASIDDPRVADVRILRPQEIPTYVAEGMFDLGITGRDWIEEQEASVTSLSLLGYSKATSRPIHVVLAVPEASPFNSLEELKSHGGKLRVATEYPKLTARTMREAGIDAEVLLSYGATEAKVPEIADCVVEITETGRALRAAGLKVIHTLLISNTELIANPASANDPEKRHAMEQLKSLLLGTLEARTKVLVKLNVGSEHLQSVLDLLPSMRSPTIAELSGGAGYALETVVAKREINVLIPALKDAGASDLLEIPLAKIIH